MVNRRVYVVHVYEHGLGYLVTVPELPEVAPFTLKREHQAEDAARYYIAKVLSSDPDSFELDVYAMF